VIAGALCFRTLRKIPGLTFGRDWPLDRCGYTEIAVNVDAMKVLQPIAWTKGTFLTPQHLQAQDAYFENLLRFRLDAISPWPWGFTELSIDHGELERGTLSIRSAAGLFPDGLPFEIPDSDAAPPPRALKDAVLEGEDTVDLVLAVPVHRHSGANLASAASDTTMRYHMDVRELPDDNAGGREKPIQIARKNFLLLTRSEASEGYTHLPLARIQQTGPATWILDQTFIPTSLRVPASQRLASMASELAEILHARSDSLASSRAHANRDRARFTSADVARFWLLYTVNTMFPIIRHMSDAPVHPSELFGAMLSLAGSLTAFSTDTRPTDLPVYDHDNATGPFRDLDTVIRHLLDTVIPSNAFSFPLRRIRPFVYASTLDTQRFLPAGANAWLGIRSSGARPQDVLRTVPEVVKITSGAHIDELYQRATGGVRLAPASEPEAIPIKTEFYYFPLDTLGEDWQRVRRAGDIAVYVPDSIPDPTLELVVVLPDES
jgi:type VI secretion system protein ImpJ